MMKTWLKRIASAVCAAAMCAAMLPTTVFAEAPEASRSTNHYEVVIQAVVRDAEGKWVSTNALTSKNFSGTTLAGSSSGYDGEWQWTPEDNGYRLTADLNSNANAWGRLKAPSVLWEYDPDELTLVGIGKNASSTEVSYAVPDYDWQWDSKYNEFSYYLAPSAGFTDYRTYIFEQKAPEEPTAPGKPGDDVVQNLLSAAVKVECTNTAASHASKTYGLLADSYTIGDVTGDETNGYTVSITVQPSEYVAQYSTDMGTDHILDPNTQQAETITLKWSGSAWTVNSTIPVTFTVKCSSEPTPPEPEYTYTINDFTKERVTGGEPNDAVFDLDGYTINYDDGTIDFTENESVALLYKLTVTGNEGACYNIEDQGASLVGWTEPTKPAPIDGAFVGEIPANGTAYFYVAKTFTAADIQNGKLVNTATITGATPDDGLDAAIDPDGNNQYTVTAETDATGPETGDEKVSKPGLEKWIVTEDGNKIEMDDIAAGTTVNFQLNSNVPDDLGKYITVEADDPTIKTANSVDSVNSYELTFVDTLDRMFDDPTNFEVKIGDKVLTEDQYALDLTDTHNFMITLDLAELYHAGVITNDDIKNTTPITVTYAATLNKEATAGIYANKAQVVYTDGDSYEGSSMDTVWVRTYALDVFKYDQATNEGLEGAEFVLTLLDDDENDVSSWMLTSGADGKIHVDGLDAGSYELRETKAPEGYVCSDEVLKFDISYEAAGSDYMIEIEFANVLIPHTGGTGTLMYTIGGIAIIALAGVLLIVYRKSRKKQER